MRRPLIALLAAPLVAAFAPASAEARQDSGVRPDPSFGNGLGYVTLELTGQATLAYDAIVTADGIIVAGQASPPDGNGQVLVAKYNTTGQLDPGFATQGIFVSSLPVADAPFLATAIAQDASGRLVLAGGYGPGSVLVMRLTAAGQVDPTFGTNGLTTIPVNGTAQSMVLQPDGRILVGASDLNEEGRPMVVSRLTPDGAIDPTFGTSGSTEVIFWDPVHASSAGVTGLAVTPNGEIVAAGHVDYIGGDGHGSAAVFRLTSSGQLDPSYGTAGGVEVAFANPDGSLVSWFPCAMTLDADGRATVTGDASPIAGNAIQAIRLTAAGVLDPSFGTAGDGRAVIPGASGGEDTTCGAAASGGNFTVGAGASLAQLLPDGTPNPSFAPGGITNIGTPANLAINAVVLPNPQTAVLAGVAAFDVLYVSRFLLPTPPAPPTTTTTTAAPATTPEQVTSTTMRLPGTLPATGGGNGGALSAVVALVLIGLGALAVLATATSRRT